MLLRPNDGAWTGNPNPPDEVRSREAIVFHGIACDEAACSPQSCLAVNSDCAGLFFDCFKKSAKHFQTWDTAVAEE